MVSIRMIPVIKIGPPHSCFSDYNNEALFQEGEQELKVSIRYCSCPEGKSSWLSLLTARGRYWFCYQGQKAEVPPSRQVHL
jgi:hypothetical protein